MLPITTIIRNIAVRVIPAGAEAKAMLLSGAEFYVQAV